MYKINGKTSVYGIIGNPVAHSFSPIIHAYLAEKTGLNMAYVPFDVEKNHLKSAIDGAYSLNIQGANVTVPHKISCMEFLCDIDESAKRVNAVNTLKRTENGFEGYNTDVFGVKETLIQNDINVENKSVLIVGAGGAAYAVFVAVCDNSPKEIFLLNRNINNGNTLVNHIKGYYNIPITFFSFDDVNKIPRGNIIIQTTSVGLKEGENPLDSASLIDGYENAFDLIYTPFETPFLAGCKALGLKTFNGFDMLIYQGIKSFEIWNDISFSEDFIRKAREDLDGIYSTSYGRI